MRCTGEYGELLLSSEAGLQPGEEPMSVSSTELVQTLETVLSRPTISPVGREYALTALMKLSTRLPDHSQRIQVGPQLDCLVLTTPLTAIEISVCQACICLGCSQQLRSVFAKLVFALAAHSLVVGSTCTAGTDW